MRGIEPRDPNLMHILDQFHSEMVATKEHLKHLPVVSYSVNLSPVYIKNPLTWSEEKTTHLRSIVKSINSMAWSEATQGPPTPTDGCWDTCLFHIASKQSAVLRTAPAITLATCPSRQCWESILSNMCKWHVVIVWHAYYAIVCNSMQYIICNNMQ